MSRRDAAAAELFNKMQGALHCHNCRILVHTLGEACARIGNLAERSRTLSDIVACKCRSLEHDRIGRIEDLGIETSHDTCQSNGLLSVADNEILVI